MTLPADVTVVVQGPVSSDLQLRHIHEIVGEVNTIASGYREDTIEIPTNCSLAKLMAIRHSREEYLTKLPGIVGINWIPGEESGVIKLWSLRSESLKNAKSIIASASLDSDGDEPVESVDITWPDPCLDRVFRHGSARETLRDFMDSLPSHVQITYPSQDDSIAFQLKGPSSDLSSAKMEARILLESVMNELSTASVVLTTAQYEHLISDNHRIMEVVQSTCGVEINLDPNPGDLNVHERYDLSNQALRSEKSDRDCDDLWVDIMNPTMNTVRVKIIQSTSYTGSSVKIVANEDESPSGKKAFEAIIEPISADICFRIDIPLNAVTVDEKAEWLKWSLKQTFATVEAYGITEIAILIEEREICTLPVSLVYKTAAEVVVEVSTASRLHSLRHINLCVSDIISLDSESKLLMPLEEDASTFLAALGHATTTSGTDANTGVTASSQFVPKANTREIIIRGLETDVLLATVELTEKLQ